MKIGIDGRVFNHPNFGGVERYTSEICHHLARSAHISIFKPQSKSRYLQHIWLQTGLRAEVIKSNVDVLFCPVMTGPIFLPKEIPMVVTIHDLAFLRFPDMYGFAFRKYYETTIPLVLRRANSIICLTNTERHEMEREFPFAATKLSVVNSGIAEIFHQSVVFGEKEKIILAVASLNKHKNLVRLLKAFGLLMGRIPHKLVLVGGARNIVSTDSAIAEELRKLPADRVISTGHVPDSELLDWYRKSEIFVFPSLFEGFGFPPLEAMASGCAVAASSSSCIPEVCGDGALYFDALSELDIAEKIVQLAEDSQLREDLINRGKSHARSFTWEATARKTLGVISTAALQ